VKETIWAQLTLEASDPVYRPLASPSAASWMRRCWWAADWGVRVDTSGKVVAKRYREFAGQWWLAALDLLSGIAILIVATAAMVIWPIAIVPWRIFCAFRWPRRHETIMKHCGQWPEKLDGGGL